MGDNIITARFVAGKASSVDYRYQYDYGQILLIEGIDLPDPFEIHFANDQYGEAVTQIGHANQVEVPDAFFQSGEYIYAWIYIHEAETDGRTKYLFRIPVRKRAEITDGDVPPVEQTAVTEAIALLTTAIERCESAVIHLPQVGENGNWYVWDGTKYLDTGTKAQGEDGESGFSPIVTTEQRQGSAEIIITDAEGEHSVTLYDGTSSSISVEETPTGRTVIITDASGTESYEILDGHDGTSVTAEVETITGGHAVTITDAEGDHTFNVMDGTDGKDGRDGIDGHDGAPGKDGTSVVASVSQTEQGAVVTVTDASGTTTATLTNGHDGTSPELSETSITGGHRVTMVDAQGTTTFDVMDGSQGPAGYTPIKGVDYFDGAQGPQGPAGQNGTSVTASVETITGGHSVTLTDKDGDHTFNVMDGVDGKDGKDGSIGQDGSSAYASVSKSGNAATITLTDKNGTTTAVVYDGTDGQDGQDGESGVYIGTSAPSDPDVNVWIDTDGTDDIAEIVAEVVDQVEVKTETVSGTAVTITGVANTRYVCGEVSTISITPPQSGIIDVIFTSGSSVAVLTLPQTVKMPSGFAVAANKTYEINILDGVYGVVAEWT